MKEKFKSVSSLLVICLVMALLLAAVNYLTAPVIEEAERQKTFAALREVLPNGQDFEAVDLSAYTLPGTVTEVFAESTGGYVIKLNTSGYAKDMVILCGISADGRVAGSKLISSGETPSIGGVAAESFATEILGKDEASIDAVDTVAGATKTTAAYRNAVRDALAAVKILKGGAGA